MNRLFTIALLTGLLAGCGQRLDLTLRDPPVVTSPAERDEAALARPGGLPVAPEFNPLDIGEATQQGPLAGR